MNSVPGSAARAPGARRTALLLFALTIAIHAVLVAAFGIAPHESPDARMYDRMAVHVSRGEGIYYEDAYAPSITFRSFRSPTFALLAGAVYAAIGYHPGAVIVLHVLLGGLITALIYLWSRRMLGEREGVLAALLVAGYWRTIYYESQLLTEILFVTALVATLYTFQEVWSSGGKGRALASGALLGIASLTRPAAITFLPLGVGLLMFVRPLRRREAVLLAAGVVAILIPWWIRNYAVHGAFVPFLTASGPPFYDGNRFWQGAAGGDPPASGWEYLHRNPMGLSEVGIDRWIVRDAWGRIVADPLAWIGIMLKKAVVYFTPLPRDVFMIPYRLVAPWILLGAVVTLRTRPRAVAVLSAAALSQYFFTILFLVDLRYRYPVEIVALPLAAAGVGWVWSRWGRLAAAAAFGAHALLQGVLLLVQRSVAF